MCLPKKNMQLQHINTNKISNWSPYIFCGSDPKWSSLVWVDSV